jgi:hypothetical protein
VPLLLSQPPLFALSGAARGAIPLIFARLQRNLFSPGRRSSQRMDVVSVSRPTTISTHSETVLTTSSRCETTTSPSALRSASVLVQGRISVAAEDFEIERELTSGQSCSPGDSCDSGSDGEARRPGSDGEIKRTGVRWLPSVAKACLHIGFCKFLRRQNEPMQGVRVSP